MGSSFDRKWTSLAIMAATAVLIAACGGGAAPAATSAPATTAAAAVTTAAPTGAPTAAPKTAIPLTKMSIRLNFTPNAEHAPIFYGHALGYYREEGVDLDIQDGKGSQFAVDDVVAGGVTIGFSDAANVILSIGENRPVVSIGVMYGKHAFGVLIDNKFGAKSFKDLAGKSITVSAGSPETLLLPAAFKNQAVDPASVTLVNVAAATKTPSYMAGQGDGTATNVASVKELINSKRPSTALLFSDAGITIPNYVFVVTKTTLQDRADALAGFLRASYRAYDAASKDPKAAVESIAKARPDANIDTALMQKSWDGYKTFACSAGMKGSVIGRHADADWTKALEIAQQYLGLKGALEVGRFTTNQFFTGAAPVSKTTC